MMTKVKSVALKGLEGIEISVEVDISSGLPSFNIVGLPDEAVQEARERVRSAIKNSGFEFPIKRITVNLAPAEVKKEGSTFDLPIALGILCCVGAIKEKDSLKNYYFIGELSLDGSLRKVSGALPMAVGLSSRNSNLVVPMENAFETEIVDGINIYAAKHIKEIVEFINGDRTIVPGKRNLSEILSQEQLFEEDMSDIKGQNYAKRALEIAAAGGHNIVMIGSPGSGKTLLARRLPTILPPMNEKEALEVTQIYSVAGLLKDGSIIETRPFRAPHHTASPVAIIGGGNNPKPGEISLAHLGVLFLDELPEFRRDVLESLRQPLEDGIVSIARAKERVTYPSRFMLIGAMNPCPCGWFGDKEKTCSCSISEIKRYRSKVSGPMWDRFDIQAEVPRLLSEELINSKETESSKSIKERVTRARKTQEQRYRDAGIFFNSALTPRLIKHFIPLGMEEKHFLESLLDRFKLTGRGYDRVLKVARTIADLEGSRDVKIPHILEAVQYRKELSVIE